MDVALTFIEDPHTSVRKAEALHELDKKLVHNILKEIKFHPYKVKITQELMDGDQDRRVEFCEEIIQRLDGDPIFTSRIVFSDEATFMLNGEVNRHNCRYWSDTNPHWTLDLRTQYPEKLNVWAGIFNDRIIGPFFIEGNLNAEKYEALLRDQVYPAILAVAGDINQVWYQQDGAPAHFGRFVRGYLDANFRERWIGRRGEIEWPARSPDLSPLDFFLWGYLKSKVYETRPENLRELRRRIEEECARIPPEMFRRSIVAFGDRLHHCLAVNGEQFEHLL